MNTNTLQEAKASFGIDLGTTYSAIAMIDEHGKPVVLKNDLGLPTTPSVVFFDEEGKVSVGQGAKAAIPSDPDRGKAFIKREMGNPDFKFEVDGKNYSPAEISALILKKLAQDAESQCNIPVKDVVITCPAYFGTIEKENTKLAGELAGFNVLNIINEPTAAAYAYAVKQKDPINILVYDLGGGTFDVTAMSVENDKIEVVASGGDKTLGGKDWDFDIAKHIVDVWQEETGETIKIISDDPEENEQLREDPNIKYIQEKLLLDVEGFKCVLSGASKVMASFSPIGLKPLMRYDLTREKFDEITKGRLDTTIEKTKSVLEDAAKTLGHEFKFQKILLVGGSTMMPQVATRIEEEFGIKPEFADPNEAVAKGAAIYAQQGGENADNGEGNPVLVERLGKSYGIVAFDTRTNNDYVSIMLMRNTKLTKDEPAENNRVFATIEANVTSIPIVIMESEIGVWHENMNAAEMRCEMGEAVEVKRGDLKLPGNLPANSPIDVTFSSSTDGILKVKAVCRDTGEECIVNVENACIMTEEEKKKSEIKIGGLTVQS